MPDDAGVPELLEALAQVLPEWTDGWYLFGAQAVQVWGLPRLSADVDVTVRLRHADAGPMVKAMATAGFALRVDSDDDFVKRTRVLPFVHRPTRIPLDVVLAGPGPEEEFLRRALHVRVCGVLVPVITPEDLVISKILAGRPKDLEDIRGIVREQEGRIDLDRVRSFLALLEEALDQSDLLPLFESQLRATR